MTVAELSRLLYQLDVPSDLYRLDGSHFELAHVIARRPPGWAVFLSERGEESDLVEFADEHTACAQLLGRVCLDLAESDRLKVSP